MQARNEAGRRRDGIRDRASIDAGVKIMRWPDDFHFHRGDASKRVTEGRVALGGHSGVRDGDGIASQFGAVFFQKCREVSAPDLLLAFDEKNHIHRERTLRKRFADAENVS